MHKGEGDEKTSRYGSSEATQAGGLEKQGMVPWRLLRACGCPHLKVSTVNCRGPASAGSRGYPQDEWRRGEREDT